VNQRHAGCMRSSSASFYLRFNKLKQSGELGGTVLALWAAVYFRRPGMVALFWYPSRVVRIAE